ncbi:MAG TPA: phosphatidylglycerophosphatase A [Lacipirellulaceae bacterium]|nr:phosphatidylglycerophosphatase A [Lacipirellulaceae bacterium]
MKGRAAAVPGSNSTLASRLSVWLATGLGVGLVSPAPGTIGGLWGLALVPVILQLPDLAWQAAATAAVVLAAVAVCGRAARTLGVVDDEQSIVLDEIAALPIVFLGVPAWNWTTAAVGYALFRLFDIAKPGLARSAERLPGGWGVVADDVVAAALAWATFRGLLWLDAAAGWGWLPA